MTEAEGGLVAILEPSGAVNSRAAGVFERDVLKHFDGGRRSFVIDFTLVDLFTSAGIRVLVMLSQRLPSVRGLLVLCGMSPHVRMVFEVAGLASQFTIVDTRAEAMVRANAVEPLAPRAAPVEPDAAAWPLGKPQETPGPSALAQAVRQAVDVPGAAPPAGLASSAQQSTSPLAAAVRSALERRSPRK